MDDRDRPVEFLIYGEGEAINHIRILIQANDYDEASKIVDANIVFWREAIAVTSVMTSSRYTEAAVLGANSSAHPVIMGEGDAAAPLVALNLQWVKPVPANYNAAATAMATWPEELRHHLYFLAKFLNPNLPADVRWLQGYRFLEWHFERGGTNLGKNREFRDFLEQSGSALDQFKPAGRTRPGFLEEIRAIVAHALLADRPTADARDQIQHAVTNTFSALESLVMTILNQLAPAGVEFKPKPLPPA
jgi:hypothetical protein